MSRVCGDDPRSIEELKRQSATERLQQATEKASKIVSEAQIQAQGMNDSLIAVKAEYEAKKAYVREADKISDVSMNLSRVCGDDPYGTPTELKVQRFVPRMRG